MNAVFTSCGNRSDCADLWTGKDREYDIVATYYGDDNTIFNMYCDAFDIVFKHKGSKFQNFFSFYRNSNIFEKYERIFILDDDIIMNTQDINSMFDISSEYNLTVCQPSFDNKSKISHEITKSTGKGIGRYTNFVEVNTPLMTRASIQRLNAVYHDSLIGWGVDYLYMWANNDRKVPSGSNKKFAVIDSVKCTNPAERERTKEGRELNKIPNYKARSATWTNHASKIHCPVSWTAATLGQIL